MRHYGKRFSRRFGKPHIFSTEALNEVDAIYALRDEKARAAREKATRRAADKARRERQGITLPKVSIQRDDKESG